MNDLPGPMLHMSGDGRSVLQANAAGRAWLGCPAGPPPWSDPPADVRAFVERAREAGQASGPLTRLVDGEPEIWAIEVQPQGTGWKVWAMHLPWWSALERSREQARQDQRELIVREVHHRIKNNLQALAGLLGRLAREHPALQPPLQRAVSQVRSWALVYGLQGGLEAAGQTPDEAGLGGVDLEALLRQVATSVSELFGTPFEWRGPGEPAPAPALAPSAVEPSWRAQLWSHLDTPAAQACGPSAWRLAQSDATSVALCLNELLVNASKHSEPAGATVRVDLRLEASGLQIEIRNRGTLTGTAAAQPGLSQGLSLVRALLPRRGARFELVAQEPWVCARLHFGPPCVWRGAPAPTQSPQRPDVLR